MLKLYSFAQSSASYRVRIALALKGLEAEIIPISLLDNSHQTPEYTRINPQTRVPFLIDGGNGIGQSLAIIDYLEEKFGGPSVYPKDVFIRAKCRAFSHAIAADIFPLQNLSTRRKLAADFNQSEEGQALWSKYWIEKVFASLETELESENKSANNNGYLFAEYPTLADICLVPQMRNARRYKVDLERFPRLVGFDEMAAKHEAFVISAPEAQIG